MLKLLYISDCYAGSSIFASQVHSLCEHQVDFLDITLLAHTHGRESPCAHNYSLQLRRWIPNMSMPIIAAAIGAGYGLTGKLDGYDVVHCRGHVMSFVAVVARIVGGSRVKIIADIRGESAAEADGAGSRIGWLKRRFMRWMESIIFRKVDHVCFVSEAMRNHFCSMYDIASSRTSVYPTLVDTRFFRKSAEKRAQKRAELKLRDDQFVYVYSGGVSYWQNVDKIIVRFASVSRNNDRLVLLILTTAPSAVWKMISELGVDRTRIIVLSVPYQEVGAYLNAADAGLLIRENNIVNRVASPTKANEYFASGLPTITALEGINATDYTPWVRKVTAFQSLEEVAAGHRSIYSSLCGEKDSP